MVTACRLIKHHFSVKTDKNPKINNIAQPCLVQGQALKKFNERIESMQLAIDVFIDMFKSKEIYIIIGGAIIMWIALEKMDR